MTSALRQDTEVEPVYSSRWGRDHWRTLLYVETRVVDHDGKLDNTHMRTNPRRHPAFVPLPAADRDHVERNFAYPTVLDDGTLLREHDDWDCVLDFEKAGLLASRTVNLPNGAAEANITLTDLGWEVAGWLRRYRAEHRGVAGFAYLG